MAYYGPHAFSGYGQGYSHPRRHAHPFAAPPLPAPATAYEAYGGLAGHPFFTAQHPSFATAAPSPTADYYAEEEAAALAHLRAVQQRRHQAEAEAARHVAIQAEVERREALQRESERRREEARQQVRAHAQALAAARQAQVERAQRARVAAIESAQIYHAHEAAIRQAVAAAEADRREKRELAAAAAHAHQQRQKEIAARRQAAYQQWAAQQAVRAAGCAGRCARKQVQAKKDESGWKELNQVLEQVFGVEPETVKPQGKEVKEVQQAAPAPAPAPAPVATPATKAPEPAAEPAKFPEDLNSLLSSFLGLRVDPLATNDKDSTPAVGSNGVPEGLNELLGQFGLVFEPETPATASTAPDAASKTSTSAAAPAPVSVATEQPKPAANPVAAESSSADKTRDAPTPLTSFLNGMADLPPFVRDILENVEIAFRESEAASTTQAEAPVQGKGKGVAEGEKPTKPIPTPAAVPATPAESASSTESVSSIQTLNHIADELHLATESFTFPTQLAFSPSPSAAEPTATEPTPALLFNRSNRPYHAQAHKLLQLLLQADSVSSGGDKAVRQKRKEVVRAVEHAIEEMEQKRDAVWAEVKQKRERGEEEEIESGSTTSASSVSDGEIQHIDHADAEPEHEHDTVEPATASDTTGLVDEATPVETAESAPAAQTKDEPKTVEGFDVPAVPALDAAPSEPSQHVGSSIETDSQLAQPTIQESEGSEPEDKVDVDQKTEVPEAKETNNKVTTVEAVKEDEGYEIL